MKYSQLGAKGPRVSVVAFGAWQLTDPAYWGAFDPQAAERAVHAAIDVGITLFDTAEMYGQGDSERRLGKALESRRGQVLVASKVTPENCRPDRLRHACEATLTRLGTDVIDLYQVHWPSRETPFSDTFGEMARLREEGKIRYIGVSNFGAQDLTEWLKTGDCVSDQLAHSLLFRATEYAIQETCRESGVGILAYMPLLQGVITGRWTRLARISHEVSSRDSGDGCYGRRSVQPSGRQRVGTRRGRKARNLLPEWPDPLAQ
jgi:myo-inositol catabolism protein IolS